MGKFLDFFDKLETSAQAIFPATILFHMIMRVVHLGGPLSREVLLFFLQIQGRGQGKRVVLSSVRRQCNYQGVLES